MLINNLNCRDWDGRVYGLPIDPIAVIISILLYLLSVIPVSLGVFIIFAIKGLNSKE